MFKLSASSICMDVEYDGHQGNLSREEKRAGAKEEGRGRVKGCGMMKLEYEPTPVGRRG